MKTLLRIEELTKIYKVRKGIFKKDLLYALKNVSLNVVKGEILGIVGESGSGKSTLGKIVLRLERPTYGRVLFENRDIFSVGKDYTKKVSVIFQDPRASLNPRMSVKSIVEEPLVVHKVSDREKIVNEAMEKVQLDHSLLERKPENLSGGQRQRVAIARAIVLKPMLIVADEPTASLDVSVQKEILNLFLSLRREGIAFIFITHDIRTVEKIADRVAVIYGGILMEVGSKEEVLSEPLNPYTRFLLSNVPVKHPKMREYRDYTEAEYEIPLKGCPFYPRCPQRKDECFVNIRRVSVNGRIVSCNLY